ncbi:MAG: beta-ketoacyl-[acyl-carrier-protein] synthase II [Gammaproteobacteria bacterium]|nr:beta-ketoacyl-[acyl-carrier-protein] synthase II [Gammaproteobacteria bacterium]
MDTRRVVVTGLGLLSPLGNDVLQSWTAIKEGKSGITPITSFDVSDFSTKFGGAIHDLDVSEYMPNKEARRMDRFMHYGIVAGLQAFKDSGLDLGSLNLQRAGVAVSSGIGGLKDIEENAITVSTQGPKKISPFFVPGSIINMISGNLSIKLGFQGPNIAVTTACTTGTHNIGIAGNFITSGQAEVMLVGGAEMATTPLGLGGFCAARALSTRNEAPEEASRPWDRDRDGFVLSDGAGVLVLEELEHARKRQAKIYAELVGFGMSGDAFHMTSPSPGGAGAAICMENALRNAKLNCESIDYVNAHGTSTIAGDVAETEAIKTVFASHAYELAVSSTKSMMGHLLGASGAAEAIISVLALHEQFIPPTINLENPAESCDLDYVPNIGRDAPLNYVLSNSFGFGGTNGSLIFKAYQ